MRKQLHVALPLLFVALVVCHPRTQAVLTVPASLDAAEGPSQGSIAGFDARSREQILVAGAALQALRSRSLTGVTFRRDYAFGSPYPSWTAVLKITVSYARHSPNDASRTFANNRGLQQTVVFQGSVALPASPPAQSPPPWNEPWVVPLTFSAPFAYTAGDLCLEIEGTPRDHAYSDPWFVDFDQQAVAGTVVPFGIACGPSASAFVTPAMAWGRNMVPGGTFAIVTIGLPRTAGLLLLGTQQGPAFSLDALGAPGCTLYVPPTVVIPGAYGSHYGWRPLGGLQTRIHLPSDPGLLAARFFAQGANLETGMQTSNALGLTTTNALDITLGAAMPAGNMTVVVSDEVDRDEAFPDLGRVDVSRGPVMRLSYQ